MNKFAEKILELLEEEVIFIIQDNKGEKYDFEDVEGKNIILKNANGEEVKVNVEDENIDFRVCKELFAVSFSNGEEISFFERDVVVESVGDNVLICYLAEAKDNERNVRLVNIVCGSTTEITLKDLINSATKGDLELKPISVDKILVELEKTGYKVEDPFLEPEGLEEKSREGFYDEDGEECENAPIKEECENAPKISLGVITDDDTPVYICYNSNIDKYDIITTGFVGASLYEDKISYDRLTVEVGELQELIDDKKIKIVGESEFLELFKNKIKG